MRLTIVQIAIEVACFSRYDRLPVLPMKSPYSLILSLLFLAAPLWADEAAVVAVFKAADARLKTDAGGRVIELMSPGKPVHSVADLQRLGELEQLEKLALNAPAGGDKDWGFVQKLEKLNQLTIWHGKHFSSLEPFCGLKIEGLTVGGCMGIRDLNKETPEKQRDVIFSLRNLTNLKRLNVYHSPTTSADAHLAHIAKEFPKLEDLKLDFAAPRGFETAISPDGLRKLKALPLKVLTLETIKTLTPEHMKAIAEIGSLEAVLLDARREEIDLEPLVAALKSTAPDLEVVASGKAETFPVGAESREGKTRHCVFSRAVII